LIPANTIGIVCISRLSAEVTGIEFAKITSFIRFMGLIELTPMTVHSGNQLGRPPRKLPRLAADPIALKALGGW
jgi:hypothetical protein